MEYIENKPPVDNSFFSNSEIQEYLLETSRWGKFLAIIGYVGMGLLILFAVFMMLGLSKIGKAYEAGFPMGMIGLLYIVLAVVYFFPINYLYRFSTEIKQGLISKDAVSLTSGFQNLKSLFRFMGILTIVILSLYALILIIAVPAMLFFKSGVYQ